MLSVSGDVLRQPVVTIEEFSDPAGTASGIEPIEQDTVQLESQLEKMPLRPSDAEFR